MCEATDDDILAAQEALWHAGHLARVASRFAQDAIMEPERDSVARDTARLAVKDTLDTLVRDVDAAAQRLGQQLTVADGAEAQGVRTTTRGTYCVRMTDDDLAPRWRLNDVAWIEPAEPAAVGDEVLVVFADGRRALHLLDGENHATVTLGTYDGAPPSVVDRTDIATLHFVRGRISARAIA